MNFSLNMNAAIPAGARKLNEDEAPQLRTLYVHRPLKNAEALREWAKAQGFKLTLPADDMHATVAFSKRPVEWRELEDGGGIITQDAGSPGRSVEALGTDGAVVLRFESEALADRWQQFKDQGATWDHDAYRPHVTITYDAGDIDLSKVIPYDGPLEFGEEVFGEIKGGATKRAKENLQATDSVFLIAMDRDTNRFVDADGHLHVNESNISKAVVSPYRGSEIPEFEALGLDPDQVYQLLRDPKDLEKSAKSFHGKPLLKEHRPLNATSHPPELVIGTVMNPVYEHPWLKAELVVWPASSIQGIQNRSKHEISCGYRYVAVMEPGVFEGVPYQGRMTQIDGNHVSLVIDGRVPGAVVGDSAVNLDLGWDRLEKALLSLSA